MSKKKYSTSNCPKEVSSVHPEDMERASGAVSSSVISVLSEDEHHFYFNFFIRNSFAIGLLNGALLAATASQLKFVLTDGYMHVPDAKWLVSLVVILASIGLQLVVFVLLAVVANCGSRVARHQSKSHINALNSVILIFCGIIFGLNVSSFLKSIYIQTHV